MQLRRPELSAFCFLLLMGFIGCSTAPFILLPASYRNLLPAIISSLAGSTTSVCTFVLLYGTYRKNSPALPFNPEEQQRSLGSEVAGRHVITADGRVVEYVVYGSKAADAKVNRPSPVSLWFTIR